MLKILIGVGNFSPGYGIAHVARDLASNLSKQGLDVKILTGKSNFRSTVPVVTCGYNTKLKQANIAKAVRTILAERPDFFHSHFYPMDICGALTSSKVRHIMHVHGILSTEYWFNMKVGLDGLRSYLGEALGSLFSQKMVAISNFLKCEIMRKYRIPPDHIQVIYPGIDLTCFSPRIKLDTSLLLPEISESDAILLSVGAISYRKGQHLLIEAMRKIVTEIPDAKLILIGRSGEEDRRYERHLRERIKSLELKKNILFQGFIHMEELPVIYSLADIFVTGTLWEGFGLPLAEAMACGLPVLAFNTTAVSEIIVDGYNGFKISQFDTTTFSNRAIELIQDSHDLQRMSKNARKFAEKHFSSEKNASRLVQLYESLLP